MLRKSRMAWLVSGALAFAPTLATAADTFYPVEQVGWVPLFRGRSSGCRDCQSCPSCAPGTPTMQEPTMQPTPMEPTPGMPPTQPSPQESAELPSFSSVAMAEQGMGGGAGTMILGRADALNRFNLFDNMGAEPVTRAWFAFQALNGLNSNIVGNPVGSPDQNLYRFGFEYAFSDMSSFAVQGMYNTVHNTGGAPIALEDSWSNPQFLFKRVVYRNSCSTVAATLGFVPETSTEPSTINESFSRIQPGVILFRDLGNTYFLHTGAELNIPLEDNATMSVDWVVSLGKWLYRHPSLDGCGDDCCLPWIVGVTAQVEALGKHVTSDATIQGGFFVEETDPFGSNGQGITFIRTFDFEEARHVIDMTVGTNILFCNNTALGLGYSFPVSGNQVRDGEFILSYNVFF